MGSRSLNYQNFLLALFGGNDYLKHNYKILDNLNIFPVPDGDTGTNMLATFQAGVNGVQLAVNNEPVLTIKDICKVMDEAFLHESRGNSGFIISRFFHGFFKIIQDDKVLTSVKISEGFANGLFIVKTSLLNPIEGTMVTIISAMTEKMSDIVSENSNINISELLDAAIKEARTALAKTPDMLPILAKAGVVDSGALGFIFIIQGMLSAILNESLTIEDESTYRFKPVSGVPNSNIANHIYRYCTELILEKIDNKPIEGITEFLKAKGDSIAIVDDKIFKLHIHTDNPDEIIEYLSKYGNIEKTKIDDMHEQLSLVASGNDDNSICSVLSFIPGAGFEEIFSAFGVSNFILYRDQLPSTGEILEELELIENKNIIILPNNNNILPAVLLAKDKSDKNISIISTSNVIQGIASLYGYSENENIRHNVLSMKECIDMARAMFVYKSVSDTVFDGVKIEKDDFFVVKDKIVTAVGRDPVEIVSTAVINQNSDNVGNITFYYGDSFSKSALDGIIKKISVENVFFEFETYYGGQSKEELIISLE